MEGTAWWRGQYCQLSLEDKGYSTSVRHPMRNDYDACGSSERMRTDHGRILS
jgi:hypothetical protein